MTHCTAQASSPLTYIILKRKWHRCSQYIFLIGEKLLGMHAHKLRAGRLGDTFGFDYNEMALPSFRPRSLQTRLQSKCGIMRKSSRPPLPFLLFSLLCCTGFLMKHKQKMFSVWEAVHNAHNAHRRVCFDSIRILVRAASFCLFAISARLSNSAWSRVLGFQHSVWHWQNSHVLNVRLHFLSINMMNTKLDGSGHVNRYANMHKKKRGVKGDFGNFSRGTILAPD